MRGLAFDVSHLLAGSLVLVSFTLKFVSRISKRTMPVSL